MPFELSDVEARLYKEVTEYVRAEFNRAEALQNNKRAGTVGFALTITAQVGFIASYLSVSAGGESV